MVTVDAPSILRAPATGSLVPGGEADLIVIPDSGNDPCEGILAAERCSLRLVMVGGRARIGDPDMAPVFGACSVDVVRAVLDGKPKLIDASLAARIKAHNIREPGLEL